MAGWLGLRSRGLDAPEGSAAGRPRRVWRVARVPVAIALVTSFLVARGSPTISPVEFSLLDVWMCARPARPPDPRIALVAFEKADAESYRDTRSADCNCGAISRADLGRAISRIKRGGAHVVVLDMTLDQACSARDEPGAPMHDEVLCAALDGPGETVLTATTETNPDETWFYEPVGHFIGQGRARHLIGSPVLYDPGDIVRGVSLIQTGSPSTGAREQLEPLVLVGTQLPPLALAAWFAWEGVPGEVAVAAGADRVRCGHLMVPVCSGSCIYLLKPLMRSPAPSCHAMLINWTGPVGTFPLYRLRAVLDASDHDLARWFADRIVLVGSALDRQHTPPLGAARAPAPPMVDQSGTVAMTGLEVHANALDTLMQRRFVRTPPLWSAWLLVLALSLVTAFAFRMLPAYTAVAIALVEIALLVPAAIILMRYDIWLYTALPAAAVLASGTTAAVWGYAWSLRRADALEHEVAVREAATESIVHDLKQPLAAISAMAQVLRTRQSEQGGDGLQPEVAGRILRQVESALADIDDLLTATPDRRLALQRRDFDLVALASDLAVTQAMKSDQHDVQVRGPEGGLVVHADPRLIGRALSNLIDNAIKYWPAGGTVEVVIDAVSGHAIVLVIDGGLGMGRQQQARCFGRFERVVPEELGIPGTGIGLYSVLRIAQAHSGRVEVISAPGEGSTFMLMIPLGQPARNRSEVAPA